MAPAGLVDIEGQILQPSAIGRSKETRGSRTIRVGSLHAAGLVQKVRSTTLNANLSISTHHSFSSY
jgi:hypothetical protein